MLIKALSISLLGFLVVFCVLLLLYFLTNLLASILNKEAVTEKGSAIEKEIIPIPVQEIEDNNAEIAAITAALMQQLGTSNFRVNRVYAVKADNETSKWNFSQWKAYFHISERKHGRGKI